MEWTFEGIGTFVFNLIMIRVRISFFISFGKDIKDVEYYTEY